MKPADKRKVALHEARLELRRASADVTRILREDEAGTLPFFVAGALCDPLRRLRVAIESYRNALGACADDVLAKRGRK